VSTKQKYYVRAPLFDPDPDPFVITTSVIVALVFGVAGIGLYANKNILNNLLLTFNPKIQELMDKQTEAEIKKAEAMMDAMRSLVLIVAIIVLGLGMFMYYREKQRETLMKKERRAQRKIYRRRST